MQYITRLIPILACLASVLFVGCSGPDQAEAVEPEEVEAALRAKPDADFKKAYEEWYEERAYPDREPDWEAWPIASAHRDAMPAHYVPENVSSADWSFVGPVNLPVPYRIYYGQGTTSGRVNDVAFDPNNPGTYYLAAATGGIWKTTDGGQTWSPLSDDWPSLAANAVAVHPTNSNIVFAGTGDWNGGYPYTFGLRRSADGGQTWTTIGQAQFGNFAIRRIMIDPDVPDRMMIATGKGPGYWGRIWRSLDGGLTWSSPLTQTAAWTDVEYGAPYPSNGGRWYYASGLDNGGQVWRSGDRGASWTKLNPPLSTSFQNGVEIAASKVHEATVYLLVGSPTRKVYKSTNAGQNWTDISAGFPNGSSNYNWSQSSYDFYIETSYRIVDGQPVDVVYVGLIDIVQSPDGGATWQAIGQTYTNSALTHNDQHAIKVNPSNPNQLLVGNDGGVYMLDYNPTNNTWAFDTSLSKNLGITQFYKSDFHPTDINRMIAGTQDNATPASTGDLMNWKNVGGGDGGFSAIRPDQPNTQYATSQNLRLYRTTNNWSSTTNPTPNWGNDRRAFIAPIALNPQNPNFLFAGTNYLWRYSQSGNSWAARLGGQELSVTGTVRSIAVAPSDGDTIYTGSNNGEVWMTRNGGTTWTQIDSGSPGLPDRFIRYIVVHPENPTKVYIAVSGTGTPHVWRCDDTEAATRLWAHIDGVGGTGLPNIPAQALALHPLGPDKWIYVATDIGVFFTDNGGASWQNATAPLKLPNVQINDLKLMPGTSSLYAAAWGRGIWRLPIVTWLPPSDYTLSRGILVSGTLASLAADDEDRLIVRPGLVLSSFEPPVQLLVEATSPNPAPPLLRFRLKASASATNIGQTIELFNFTTSAYEIVDTRPAPTADLIVDVNIVSNPTRFINPANGLVRARISYRGTGPVLAFPWQARVDQAVWRTF